MSADQQKRFLDLVKAPENQLPIVLFTEAKELPEVKPELPPLGIRRMPSGMPSILPIPKTYMPYEPDAFAREATGFCRVYTVKADAMDKLLKVHGIATDPGAIVLFHPACYGLVPTVIPFKPSKRRQEESLRSLRDLILSYPRGKEVSFGHVHFIGDARGSLVQAVEDTAEELQKAEDAKVAVKESVKADLQTQLEDKDALISALSEQVARLKEYQDRLEADKVKLSADMKAQKETFEKQLHEEDEYLEYLERKLDRPGSHDGIAAWVDKYFSGKLILHPKAVSLLSDRSAQDVDLGLICDALDFLATDYWEQRYRRISENEMNLRCSRKYNRPFEIKPTGTTTIEFTPNEYKIKYMVGARGKPVETPLDYHLGVGNSPENLLRIYFLHDDAKNLIVVGSLPRHLRAVSIK